MPGARRWPGSSRTASGSSPTSSAVDTEEVWLPDSFGYTAALPQLVALSGSRWFLTQKISWNQTNKFPHHTFYWEGLDGTRIFTHFPPVDTYNSKLAGSELAARVTQLRRQGRVEWLGRAVSVRRGGGGRPRDAGPAARLRDLDGSPRVVIERPADSSLRRQEYPMPRYGSGELYLEFHPALPSQAKTKQGNGAASTCCERPSCGAPRRPYATVRDYPYEALDRIWKLVPSSSSRHPARVLDHWVHREAAANYAAVASSSKG